MARNVSSGEKAIIVKKSKENDMYQDAKMKCRQYRRKYNVSWQ